MLLCQQADGRRPTLAQRLAIGGLAGAFAQAAIYPLEVVQTRLAVSPPGTYSGEMLNAGSLASFPCCWEHSGRAQ